MTYTVYTTEYDEVIRPLDIVDADELAVLAQKLHVLCPVESFEPLKERLESLKAPTVPTAITLLVDNSGSMRGPAISFAVGTAGIIATYLDRLGIPNEILGFTTVGMKGGQPRRDYIEAERQPRFPGRLCALRHIIYKEFDERLIDVRNNLALMFKTEILCENVDGEAVQWACERLRAYPTQRRILMVISDGAPVDDSTLGANMVPRELLPDSPSDKFLPLENIIDIHLRQVIAELKEAGDIELDAVGILHDVSRYYGVGEKVVKLEELAPTAIGKLETLLSSSLPT